MAGRVVLRLDTGQFDELAAELDALGADLKSILNDALEQVSETVIEDTIDAIDVSNMPRGGKYSYGDTAESAIKSPKIEWNGTIASSSLGFDFNEPGAGGYLITGTPRMCPNRALENIYARKKYMNRMNQDIVDILQDEIEKRVGG